MALLSLVCYQSSVAVSMSLFSSSFNHIWLFVNELIIFCYAHSIVFGDLQICSLLQLCWCFCLTFIQLLSMIWPSQACCLAIRLSARDNWQRVQRFRLYHVTNLYLPILTNCNVSIHSPMLHLCLTEKHVICSLMRTLE